MDKNVLIVTGSNYTDYVYQGFKDAKDLGIKLYLLSDGSFEPKQGYFEEHYTYDLRKTKEVLEYMAKQNVKFDAVTIKTSEWLTPLTALLAKQYGCIGNDPIVAFNCRSKYHMRKKLSDAGVPGPNFRLCRNYSEILEAIKHLGTPCVAKPVGGNASYGVFMIQNENDLDSLKENYETSIKYLKDKAVTEDVFAFSEEEMELIGVLDHVDMVTDYLVEEYMSGPEISVDAVCQNGKVSIIGIEDQIRMKPPYFMQIAGKLPYQCSAEQSLVIKDLVQKTVDALGIYNSCTHTEIIFSPDGPKVVEIGCRIGGDDLHDTIFEATGVNLMFEAIMIALGVERNYGDIRTKCHTTGQFLLPRKNGRITNIVFPEELKTLPYIIELSKCVEIGDEVGIPPLSFDTLGFVAVKGDTPQEAQERLNEIVEKILFEIN